MNIKVACACAQASMAAYGSPNTVTIGNVVFLVVPPISGVPTIFAFRGTTDCFADFTSDADALPDDDPIFGPLHSGFNAGSTDYTAAMIARSSGDYLITGHSLGGSRALIAAARAANANRAPIGVCTFGAPKPGCGQLADYLNKTAKIDGLSFARNGDPIPPLVDPYEHPYSQHVIGDAVQHSMNIFINHQIARYCADLTVLAK